MFKLRTHEIEFPKDEASPFRVACTECGTLVELTASEMEFVTKNYPHTGFWHAITRQKNPSYSILTCLKEGEPISLSLSCSAKCLKKQITEAPRAWHVIVGDHGTKIHRR